MHRLRVYVDNSVFGGVFDEEFADASKRFFELVKAGKYTVLVSDITYEEILDAPDRVVAVLTSLPKESIEEVPITAEADDLALKYLDARIVSAAFIADAIQVAAATVAKADLILSWNFSHIVSYAKVRMFNSVNLAAGYPMVEIRSPMELVYDSEDQDV